MGKWLSLIVIVSLLIYAFIDSHALEISNQSRQSQDMQYYTPSKTTIHWSRYWDYLRQVPVRVRKAPEALRDSLDRMTR